MSFCEWGYGVADNVKDTLGWWFSGGIDSTSSELMQFTGLKDRSGVEIYEGDILSPGLREVSWQQGAYSMGDGWYTQSHELKTGYWTLSKTQTEDAEVIGNIYQNPELLGGSK